jgi:phosphoribosylformimino-5-aminoimidazole carboxamide ribotide isomerase
MIVYPAIDLKDGQVVRLKEGDLNQKTVFSHDPVATAEQWVEQGAGWIHMVNLDGAFATVNTNSQVLERAARLPARIQFAGGLRSLEDMARAFEQGASRVVLGTIAVQQPEIVAAAIERWGAEQVCVALDARDGKVTTHGWQQMGAITPVELGSQLAGYGLRHALYTDVTRDGLLEGVNVAATVELAQATGLQVIASGGVSTREDIHRLRESRLVAGVVIGMALYQGRFTLQDALQAAEGNYAG